MSDIRAGGASLGAISTLWTVVRQAHGADVAVEARQELCRRYHGAVERFLRIAVQDPSSAAELSQEFAVQLLRGDLAGATPARGRFRDFVKGVLRHLIVDRYRRRLRSPEVQAPDSGPEPQSPHDDFAALDREWALGWRQELLNRAWDALAEDQERTGQPFFVVLRYRGDHPELRSHEMATALGKWLGKDVSRDWVRQTIHRARERFGELLLAEIADTISNPDADALADELADLELLQYCQAALEKWQTRRIDRE
jgi:RNA polymerase sigma-70 factor (ECF subfamily)